MKIDLAPRYQTEMPTVTTEDPDEVARLLDAERDRSVQLGDPIMAFMVFDSAAPRGGAGMDVGINGDRGFILFNDPKIEGQRRTSWETAGDREGDDVRYLYFGGRYDDAVAQAGAEVPYEQIKAAVLEFMESGQRPTCVEWQPVDRRRG